MHGTRFASELTYYGVCFLWGNLIQMNWLVTVFVFPEVTLFKWADLSRCLFSLRWTYPNELTCHGVFFPGNEPIQMTDLSRCLPWSKLIQMNWVVTVFVCPEVVEPIQMTGHWNPITITNCENSRVFFFSPLQMTGHWRPITITNYETGCLMSLFMRLSLSAVSFFFVVIGFYTDLHEPKKWQETKCKFIQWICNTVTVSTFQFEICINGFASSPSSQRKNTSPV